MDWNDLNYILAVVEHDGLEGAAHALGVHPTTVSRRLRQVESRQQVKIFERFRHGVTLTDAGADVLDVARQMRTLTDALSARLQGRETELSGTIRLTSFDSLLRAWMADFAAFRTRYPEIQLELSSGLAMANLTQREADIAIRIAGSAPPHLIGSRVCDVAHGVYASRALIARYGPDATRADYPWVSYDLSVFRGVDAFIAHRYPGAEIAMRVPRIDLLMAAIQDGVGIGILNCHAGDANPALRRVGPTDAGLSHLWLLTHPELRGSARIRAFTAFARTLVARDRDRFEGREPQSDVIPSERPSGDG